MQETIEKLKNMKNATQEQVDKVINKQAYNTVIKDLKESGIEIEDLSDEEFKQLLAEEVKKTKTFTKGALVGAGALAFLELLG